MDCVRASSIFLCKVVLLRCPFVPDVVVCQSVVLVLVVAIVVLVRTGYLQSDSLAACELHGLAVVIVEDGLTS